ncbi:PREDICTED: uncharacterized protein LOC108764661 [Trachymyrmex cornetzi]|uniref:uncharacterized protein LOC108764661 n=1 Tax=Trachymyrmex cornetzi TaxID=471704 RepID=UPI00084F108F|nr:PREDICTED: uncharacterized protein LOC108764661 [Trachymyrmex cornetzi]
MLADKDFHKPGAIDLLIGSGTFWQIMKDEHIELLPGQPRMQNMSLGWILGGTLTELSSDDKVMCNLLTNDELSQQLERMWQSEEIIEQRHYSPEERKCEEHFKATMQRNIEGRFVVGLPQREDIELAESYSTAVKRLYALENRFARQPELKLEYIQFMEKYETLGHMSRVEENTSKSGQDIYYIPHHLVVRSNVLTSKLRVVFDASALSASGVSLNHKLLVDPQLQDTLFALLLKFRMHQYVLTADLEMMYRQVLVKEQDRDLQRILWRSNNDEEIQIFRLNTLTYGTSSAPFLAIRCLKELAIQESDTYPTAARVLQGDFYMDDLLTGTHTEEEVCRLQQELMELLQRGRFYLRKWRSNNRRVLSSLAQDSERDEFLILNKHEVLKTLGLHWNAERDYLQYEVQIMKELPTTKRQLLSLISKIFDPLDLIEPVLVVAK